MAQATSLVLPRLLLVLLLGVVASTTAAEDQSSSRPSSTYLVGAASADITGPAADVNMMGYARPTQIVSGLHFRLRARAFIIADSANTSSRFAFVSIDACMASQLVTLQVLEKLKEMFGDLYTAENVAISGIHTHAGPGGYLQYVLYDITSLGFVRESFDPLVAGIVRAISDAHARMRPARLQLNAGEVLDANINRSPTAYANNPPKERDRYRHNVDKQMVLLKLVEASGGKGIGLMNWFAVHCTSMNNTNSLISGDNKGAASMMMEEWAAGEGNIGGEHPFVSAFAQSNVGDTSPNVAGAFCLDSGLPCEETHSTCHGKNEYCHGRGPAWPDDFESTRVIGERQFLEAKRLYQTASEAGAVFGPVGFRHTYVDFGDVEVEPRFVHGNASGYSEGNAARTCPPAMGYSFAAGTTDGPGAFDFKQGDVHGNPFWNVVRSFIKAPSAAQVKCHAPKPVLLDTGELNFPYPWQACASCNNVPRILPLQILRVGQLIVLSCPSELSTMAGRRLREAVKAELISASATLHASGGFGNDTTVVIAGLTNTYSSYVTTFEEYEVQRYEGGSTLYGPHTLAAYIQEFVRLARALATDTPILPGPDPPSLLNRQLGFLTPVVADTVPAGAAFGDVTQQPSQQEYHHNQTVRVVFRSGCPRNDVRTEGTFLAIERLREGMSVRREARRSFIRKMSTNSTSAGVASHRLSEDGWETVYTDSDWSTRFMWSRPSRLSMESFATITWTIPPDTRPGTYRVTHFGAHKHLLGHVQQFQGISDGFQVV
eukprot:jgi/Chlat1/5249/Chrsp33S05010